MEEYCGSECHHMGSFMLGSLIFKVYLQVRNSKIHFVTHIKYIQMRWEVICFISSIVSRNLSIQYLSILYLWYVLQLSISVYLQISCFKTGKWYHVSCTRNAGLVVVSYGIWNIGLGLWSLVQWHLPFFFCKTLLVLVCILTYIYIFWYMLIGMLYEIIFSHKIYLSWIVHFLYFMH